MSDLMPIVDADRDVTPIMLPIEALHALDGAGCSG